MVRLELSETDAVYVRDILTMWIDGHNEAEAQVMTDPNHEEVEDMAMAVDDLRQQKKSAERIRDLLDGATFGR